MTDPPKKGLGRKPVPVPPKDLDQGEYEALAGFRFEFRKFLSFSARAAQGAGLRPQQYQALLAIRARSGPEGVTVKDLATELFIGQSTAVELLDRLERMNLVRRDVSSADARRTFVSLTEEARRALAGLASVHRDELRQQVPALIALLSRIQNGPGGPGGPGG